MSGQIQALFFSSLVCLTALVGCKQRVDSNLASAESGGGSVVVLVAGGWGSCRGEDGFLVSAKGLTPEGMFLDAQATNLVEGFRPAVEARGGRTTTASSPKSRLRAGSSSPIAAPIRRKTARRCFKCPAPPPTPTRWRRARRKGLARRFAWVSNC